RPSTVATHGKRAKNKNNGRKATLSNGVGAILAAIGIIANDACAAEAESANASLAGHSRDGGDAKVVHRRAARLVNGEKISVLLAGLDRAVQHKIERAACHGYTGRRAYHWR